MHNDAPNTTLSAADDASLRRLTLVWILTLLTLFPVLTVLGGLMRMVQGNLASLPPDRFYSVMTLHGVGMVGLWFVGAMAAAIYLLRRYVAVSVKVNWFAYLGTVLGVILLLISTLWGNFGAGWYFLYPLPFHAMGAWGAGATGIFFATLAVLGVTWTLWGLDLVRAIAARYSLSAALGWQYILAKKGGPEVPPIVIISLVSVLAVLVGLISAVVLLVLVCVETLGGGVASDALLMKNLTFLFGHLLVNITLYLGVAALYELLPVYSGRPWKTNRIVAIAWNAVLLLVVCAYLHHLYMDFVQLRWMQVLGQMASYLVSIPAAVVTIYGVLSNLYHASMRWTLSSSLLVIGVLGWTIGGIAAVIDSTVAVNLLFHNTLWVPAHFHTYYLLGVTLMVLGTCYHVVESLSGLPENKRRNRLTLYLLCIGGGGFLLMFYLGGALSVPRRFANYPPDLAQGVLFARISVAFVIIFVLGLLIYIWETGGRCLRALKPGCP